MARHPGVTGLLRWFNANHLDTPLAVVSNLCGALATNVVNTIPVDSPELTEGLRKLLEAKDCFVRAAIIAKETPHA